MEENDGTPSGSPRSSDTDSPTPVSSMVQTQKANMVGGSMERADASAMVVAPAVVSSGGSGGQGNAAGGDSLAKKKRGRPRKYDADGNLRVVQPFMQHSVSATGGIVLKPPPPGFSLSPPPPTTDQVFSSSKRGRGRPPGSGNWQLLASLGELFANTAGGDFTPHVVIVYTGEDVAGKILSFSQNGPRGICVLSANGAVSNVTIRQPGSSGGILTYEGRFEILSLSGSFTLSETGGVRSMTGGLSVSLASADGRVIGGGVAGLLLAASPIQIVVGSFMPNGYKAHKRRQQREQCIMPSLVQAAPDIVPAERPISQPRSDTETCMTPMSPLLGQNDGHGIDNNINNKQIPESTISHSECWKGTEPTPIRRPSPDINVSLPSEEEVQGVF